MRIHHTTHLGRIVGTVATALVLSTVFAGTASATISGVDSPGKPCSPATCPIKAPPQGPIEAPPSGPDTTIPTEPEPTGCKGSQICFPGK